MTVAFGEAGAGAGNGFVRSKPITAAAVHPRGRGERLGAVQGRAA